jgi:GNAT superfamily N-acetyltransferase
MSEGVRFRRLQAGDLVGGFDAGSSPDEMKLTEFFRSYARQHQTRRQSVTTIALVDSADEGEILAGFATTCPGSVSGDLVRKVDRRLPRHSTPVLVLAKMATDARCRRRGIGRALIEQVVLAHAEHLASEHGCAGVYADAKTTAVAFYAALGFHALSADAKDGRPVPMFRPLSRG